MRQGTRERRSTPGRLSALLALTLGLLGFTAPASAQFGTQAGFAEAFQKDFLRRDMQLFMDYLRLEDWQRPIIEVLLDDYQDDFDGGTEACKDRMSGLKDEMLADPENAMEIALRPIKEWELEKKRMRDDFIANLRTQLSPLQMQRWPSLERAMRREKELPLGELPGEKMNLFAVLHGMELKPTDVQQIDPALLTYETRLDNALDNRRKQMEKHQPELQNAMVSRNYQEGLPPLRKIAAARSAVIDVHFIAIDEISSLLPVAIGDEFRLAILTRGYPDIFKPNSVDRLIKHVRSLPDLTQEQSAGLDQIELEYLTSLAESNERLLQAYRINAKEIPILEAKQSIARRNKEEIERGENVPSAITDEKTLRADMFEEYRNRILDLLTEEQNMQTPASIKFDRRGGRQRGNIERPAGLTNPNAPGRGNGRSRASNPDKMPPPKGGKVDSGLSDSGPPPKIDDSPPKNTGGGG
ncbi:MAG: hypothetical protein MK082_10410 [Phycisphaerales bacterium]|nr:hypothetical protein [Phycisphaerales bacterium]